MKKLFCFRKLGKLMQAATLALAMTMLFLTPAELLSQTYSVLYNFQGNADGANPNSGVTADAGGNFYGTASYGGSSQSQMCNHRGGCGAVYKLVHRNSSWILMPLYAFTGGTDGAGPMARVVFGPDGTLYGTTYTGGGSGCALGGDVGCGTVFNLRPPARPCTSTVCPWIETVLYRFTGGADGGQPGQGDLAFDQAGNLYGTTETGGADNMGTVFKLTRSGSGWTESVIYSFTSQSDGRFPVGGVVFINGNLYGVTGCSGFGGFCTGAVIYELTPSGSGWTFQTLYTLNLPQGSMSYASLTPDGHGSFYGTTYAGGGGNCTDSFEFNMGCGAVFHGALDSIFVSFSNPLDTPPLSGPAAPVSLDAAGNIYGTTVADGANALGNVFRLQYLNGNWTYISLHDFGPSYQDAFYPWSNVSVGSDGKLYGTTSNGGTGQNCPSGFNYHCGVIWQITP